MAVNFFKEECQEITDESRFGICDLEDENPAFIQFTDEKDWIAVVHNEEQKEVIFTAIDNCIDIRRSNGDKESSCDAMLTYTDNIDFVELKVVRKDWINKGIGQLSKTIQTFVANHDLTAYNKKRAFLANKKHPHFHFSHKEEMQEFKKELKVRLIIQNTIKI